MDYISFCRIVGILLITSSFMSGCDSNTPSVSNDRKEANHTEISIGQAFMNGDLEIVIQNVALHERVGESMVSESASEGGVLVAITYSMKNISSKPLSAFDKPKIQIMDSAGTLYSPDIGKTAAYATELNLDTKLFSDLNPGITVHGAEVFEVSKEAFAPSTWKVIVNGDTDNPVSMSKENREETKKDESSRNISISKSMCINVQANNSIILTGSLTEKVFPGIPNFESVANGDEPEDAYILILSKPICIDDGEQFADPNKPFNSVHLYTTIDELQPLLKESVGSIITVEGNGFAASTAHHHAPLVMEVRQIFGLTTAKQIVTQFYRALEKSDGETATAYVISEKRSSGPLSGKELTSFYSTLKTPLHLISVDDDQSNTFTAHYEYVPRSGSACDGTATVSVTNRDGALYIARIKADTGC